jgi:hypothetical protein
MSDLSKLTYEELETEKDRLERAYILYGSFEGFYEQVTAIEDEELNWQRTCTAPTVEDEALTGGEACLNCGDSGDPRCGVMVREEGL